MPDLVMRRAWAMPSAHTFTIEPIADLLARWMPGREWVDPFAGYHSPAQHRNDLNPDTPWDAHCDAEEFVSAFARIDGILFDPPYSPRQIAECYRNIGREVGMVDTQNGTLYQRVKAAASNRMPVGSLAICCGWNSAGFGVGLGFELLEVLLVAHGGAHNDTIVTVERRVWAQPSLLTEVA